MHALRFSLVTLLTAVSLVFTGLPATADQTSTASFTGSPYFTPDGDGVKDTFEATLTVSAAARVRVGVGSGGIGVDLLDRTVDRATTLTVSWDGRYHGSVERERSYKISAIVSWAAGGSQVLELQAFPFKIDPDTADGLRLVSPAAGAVLFGDVPIKWNGEIYWDFDFDVSDCGSFRQRIGEAGAPYPSALKFSADESYGQSFDASTCPAGPHTLTVRGGRAWGGGNNLRPVLSIPIVIPGSGPQLVLQPDLAAAAKVNTLLQYADGQVAPVSWPLRCRDADPSTFVLRVRDDQGEAVRTIRDFAGSQLDPCRSQAIVGGASWDGLDDRGDPVPTGRYTVEAEMSDDDGQTATDRAVVVVQAADPPLSVTGVSAGDALRGTVSLDWRPAADASVDSIAVKIPGCEDASRQWFLYRPSSSGWRQTLDLNRCPPGERELSWTASWTDVTGVTRLFRQHVPVTVIDVAAPEVRQYGSPNVIAPSQPGAGHMRITWSLSCTDQLPVSWRVTVRDTAGAEVSTLRNSPPTVCDTSELSWDGTRDDGSAVPAGSYTVVARATDAAGNSSESYWAVVVDPDAPYVASIPHGGVIDPSDIVTWTPRPEVKTIVDEPYRRATARVEGQGFAATDLTFTDQADGSLQLAGLGKICAGHQAQLSVSINWRDLFGAVHNWAVTIPLRCEDQPPPAAPLGARISGTPRTDQTLTAQVTGLGVGEEPAYRWQRDGRDIAGTTKNCYTLSASDVGHDISVRISGAGDRTAISAVARVLPGALVPATPTIHGVTRVGQRLTITTPAWRPTGATLSYQWLRDGRAVSHATGSRYTLTKADRKSRMSVRVTGRKPGYVTAIRVSAATTRIS